jgi:HflK protein
MDLLWDYIRTVFNLFTESAPFLLVGFFLAGMLRLVVPERQVFKYLGGNSFRSVGLASLLGIPIPLCSCSVLPAVASLRKSGAGKGATTSFLISTPETGVDSIGLTYALLDPIMTVMRPVAALITALLTGSLVNKLVGAGLDRDPPEDAGEEADECCADGPADDPAPQGERRTVRGVLAESARFAFGPLLDDLTQWFIIGFLLSAAVAFIVPDEFFSTYVPSGFLAMLLMLLVGIPIYVCAAAATPLAAMLIAKGLDPGAALVLLLVGPATNVTTILVVTKLLGRRVVVIYLLGVAGCALALGALVSAIYADQGIDLAKTVEGVIEGGASTLEILAAVVFAVLLARSAARTGLLAAWGGKLRALGAKTGLNLTGRAARVGAVSALVLVYLSSCFSVIGPGEVGWVLRFGRIVRTVEEPGLVVHLPAPFDRVRKLRTEEIRVVELGFSREREEPPLALGDLDYDGALLPAPGLRDDLAAQAQTMTGEESLLRMTLAVQFAVEDPFAYEFRVSDPAEVVRTFAEAAVRQAVAHRSTDEVLVGHRDEVERETLAILAAHLDGAGSGVRVTAVTLRDVHAPEEVHFAYRDVASALEDKDRSIHLAEGFRTDTLARSRAEAEKLEQEAESYRSEEVAVARGEARGFLSRLRAYRTNESITRLRLFLEAAEAALGGAKLIFLLAADVEVDLWNVKTTVLPAPVKAGAGSGEPK